MKWILSLLPFCTSHLTWRRSCLPGWRGRPFLTGYPLSPTHPISLPEPALPLLQRASENKRGLFCLGTPHLLRLKAHQPPTDAPRRSSPETSRAMLPPAPITGAEDVDTWKLFAAPCRLPAAIREPRGRKPANLGDHPVQGGFSPRMLGDLTSHPVPVTFSKHESQNPQLKDPSICKVPWLICCCCFKSAFADFHYQAGLEKSCSKHI